MVGVGVVGDRVVVGDGLPFIGVVAVDGVWWSVAVAAVDAALLAVVVAVVVGGLGGGMWCVEVEVHVEVGGVMVDARGEVAGVVVCVVGVVGLLVVVFVQWVEVDVVVVSEVGDGHRDVVVAAPECVLKVVLVVGHVQSGTSGC